MLNGLMHVPGTAFTKCRNQPPINIKYLITFVSYIYIYRNKYFTTFITK
jgi:hypothetical protein